MLLFLIQLYNLFSKYLLKTLIRKQTCLKLQIIFSSIHWSEKSAHFFHFPVMFVLLKFEVSCLVAARVRLVVLDNVHIIEQHDL